MVLWCKCGAFMGLREPLKNWSADRTGICPQCARDEFDLDALARKGVDLEVAAIKKNDDPARAEVATR